MRPEKPLFASEDLLPAEDPGGIRKRVLFFLRVLKSLCTERHGEPHSISVLDIGCGTGEYVTLPLAQAGFRITGVDCNKPSVEHAKSRASALQLDNATFTCESFVSFLSRDRISYDVIICSEVLEHLQDPLEVLTACRSRLGPGGVLIVTVPNGHGPFETEISVITLLSKVGFRGPLERLRCHGFRTQTAQDSLNLDSPHVQFFWRSDLRRLLSQAGFQIKLFAHRTFLCGPITGKAFVYLNRLSIGGHFLQLNNRIADLLPSALVSGWMLVATIPNASTVVSVETKLLDSIRG